MRLFLRKTGGRVTVLKHTDLSSWLCFAGITRAKLGIDPLSVAKGEKKRFRYSQCWDRKASGAHPALLDLSKTERPTARGHALEHSSLPEPSFPVCLSPESCEYLLFRFHRSRALLSGNTDLSHLVHINPQGPPQCMGSSIFSLVGSVQASNRQ